MQENPPGPPEGAYTGDHPRLSHALREKRSSRLGGSDLGTFREQEKESQGRSKHLPPSSPSRPPERPGRLRRHHTISNGPSHFKALQDLWRELARNADRSIPRHRGKKKGGRRAIPLPIKSKNSTLDGNYEGKKKGKKKKKTKESLKLSEKKRSKGSKRGREKKPHSITKADEDPLIQSSPRSDHAASSKDLLEKGKGISSGLIPEKSIIQSPCSISLSSPPSSSSVSSSSRSSSESFPSTGVETNAADIDIKTPCSPGTGSRMREENEEEEEEDFLLNPLRSPPAPAFAVGPHTDGPPTDGIPSVTGLSFDPDDDEEEDEEEKGMEQDEALMGKKHKRSSSHPRASSHARTSSSATTTSSKSSIRRSHRRERRNSLLVNEVSALFRRQRERSSKGLRAFAKKINEALKRNPTTTEYHSTSGHKRTTSSSIPSPDHPIPVRSRSSLSSDLQHPSSSSTSPPIESPSPSTTTTPPLRCLTMPSGPKDSPASGTEDGSEVQMWGVNV